MKLIWLFLFLWLFALAWIILVSAVTVLTVIASLLTFAASFVCLLQFFEAYKREKWIENGEGINN